MTGSQALATLLGAAAGLGMMMITAGLRAHRARPAPRWHGAARRLRAQVTGPRAAAAVLTVAVTAAVTQSPGCILAGLAAWFLPGVLGPDRANARLVARTEAVAGWTEMLRDTLAAAAGLEQSILATEHNAPAPVREHVAGLCARIRGGDRLPAALRAFAAGVADPAADLAVAALLLAAEQQARDLAPLLSALADSARQQAVMRMRVAAGRARVRTAARIIIGTTVLLTAAMITWSRPFLGPYDSPLGQLMLTAVGGCFGCAFWWLNRISRPNPEPRLLGVVASPAVMPGEASP